MTSPVVARIDIVPAVLTITYTDDRPPVRYDGVRVIVTSDTIYVWRENTRGQDPDLIIEERIADFDGRNTIGYTATLDDGTTYFFKRGTGCACGGRIRSFRPFAQGMVLGPYVAR